MIVGATAVTTMNTAHGVAFETTSDFRCCERASSIRRVQLLAVARRRPRRYAPSVASGPLLNSVRAIAFVVLLLLLTGCAAPRWETATYDRFPLNWGRVERGSGLIRVIALVPGGGVLGEEVGAELAKRGFVVVPSTSIVNAVPEVNFQAVLARPIPGRSNVGELWKLRHALHARGVDAFLIVRSHDFVAKQHLGRRFWQQAELEIHSTTEENAAFNGAIAGTAFANFHNDRASSPLEAAVMMVANLARGPGGI